MSKITRYECYYRNDFGDKYEADSEVETDGQWVDYDDHLNALQKRDLEASELEKLAAMRLEEIKEQKIEIAGLELSRDGFIADLQRVRQQLADADQLGKRLHAANNEIMALRGERNALKKRLDSATRWPVAEG